jgi:hypothetical protein
MIILGIQEMRGKSPGSRHFDASEAADLLWRVSTRELREVVRLEDGPRRGEEFWTGWRRYFDEALAEDPILGDFHDDFVRQLRAALTGGIQDRAGQ